MSLSVLIRTHLEKVVSGFAVFARTLMPAGAQMNEAELRDQAADILSAVGRDMDSAQRSEERSLKVARPGIRPDDGGLWKASRG